MRTLDLSDADLRDLQNIASESEAAWGLAQRDRYVAEINTRLYGLLARPTLAPIANDRPDLRRFLVGRHAVFYRFDESRILVVRILHQHMDAPRHLGRAPKR